MGIRRSKLRRQLLPLRCSILSLVVNSTSLMSSYFHFVTSHRVLEPPYSAQDVAPIGPAVSLTIGTSLGRSLGMLPSMKMCLGACALFHRVYIALVFPETDVGAWQSLLSTPAWMSGLKSPPLTPALKSGFAFCPERARLEMLFRSSLSPLDQS